jgi:hypothetical protein
LESVLDFHVNKLIARNVEEILEKLGDIEKRYYSLGYDEESRLEKIVLNSMRKILLNDLRELTGFSSYYGFEIKVEPNLSYGSSEATT